MKLRRSVSILLAGILASSLAACSPAKNTSATSSAEETAVAKERVITWMTTRSSWEVMNAIAASYMEENPDITIEFEVISDRSSYNQKLKILAASNELPDLFDSEADSTLVEIAATGACLDIDQLYRDLGFTDKMMEIGTSYPRMADGKLYSLAWENNVEYFWYHKDLFEKAGITDTPKSFDEFLTICQKLKDVGITPIATWPGWEDLRWLAFIPYRLEGNNYIDGLVSGNVKMSDEIGIQAAEFYQTLATNYFQAGWATSDYTNALETFMGSNATIYYIGTWQFHSFLDENGELAEDYAYFKLPTIEGATTDADAMFSNSGTGTCVNTAKYDDALKDFLTYVLDHYSNVAFNEFNTIPPMKFEANGTISEFNQAVITDCESLSGYAKTWDVTLSSAVVETLGKEIVNLGMGEITPEEFAAKIDAAIAESLGE